MYQVFYKTIHWNLMTNYLSKKRSQSLTDLTSLPPSVFSRCSYLFTFSKKFLKQVKPIMERKNKSFLNLIAYFFILFTQFSISISYINTNQNLLNKKNNTNLCQWVLRDPISTILSETIEFECPSPGQLDLYWTTQSRSEKRTIESGNDCPRITV